MKDRMPRPGNPQTVKIKRNYLKYADGSVLIEMGETKVICSASIEERVPNFLGTQGKGG